MSNKRIKSNLLTAWLVGVTLCYTAPVVLAGPLDRGEMQPRNNPAANSMIRVPGVLGQSEQSALEILQRAGLNVNTKYISQSIEKYAGRSGMVVKQTPSAGGISMLGSSVTIMIYKVEDNKPEPAGESGGGYDNSGYDSGGSNGSYDGSGYDSGGSSGGDDNPGGNSGGNGNGYDDSGRGYSTGELTPKDGSSGPDWGSPGSDSDSDSDSAE